MALITYMTIPGRDVLNSFTGLPLRSNNPRNFELFYIFYSIESVQSFSPICVPLAYLTHKLHTSGVSITLQLL